MSRPVEITRHGTAKISTAKSKFGGASGYFNGGGNYLSVESAAPFNFSGGDKTFEAWIYRSANAADFEQIFSKGWYTANGGFVLFTDGGQFGCQYQVQGGSQVNLFDGGNLSLNNWHHVAAVIRSGNLYLYVNGVMGDSTTLGSPLDSPDRFHITQDAWVTENNFNGYVDEVRVSSVARYSSNFTPQTSAFYSDAQTELLIHFDGANNSTSFIDDTTKEPVEASAGLSANTSVTCVATSTYSAKSTIASEFALQSSISRQRLAESTLLSNFDIVSATAEIIILAGASLASNFTLELLANVIKTVESTSDCTSSLAVLAGKLKSTSVNLQPQTGLTALVEVILSVKGSAGVSVTSTMQATVTRIQNSNVSLNTLVSLDVDVSRYTKPDVGFMVLRENRSYSIINE